MQKEELEKLDTILNGKKWETDAKIRAWRKTLKVEEPQPKGKPLKTREQEKAYHVLFGHIAKALNEAGLSVQEVLAEAMEMDWNLYRVKEILWKNSLKKLTGKESTTQMTKTGEIDEVYEHINRFLAKGFVKNSTGERIFIENIPFPSDESKTLENLAPMKNTTTVEYPEYTGETTI